MKTSFIFLFSLFVYLSFSQNKVTEVNYKKTYAIDFKSEEKKAKQNETKNQALQLIKKINIELNRKTYKLWFNDSLSYFYEIKQMDIENTNEIVSTLSNTGGLTDGVFYSSKKAKESINQKSFDSKKYLIYSDTDSLTWDITKQSKEIDGYTAYKATTIRQRVTRSGLTNETITAWYTPEVPTQFGPAGFNNLPGLILEIQIGKLLLYANKIEFNKDVDITDLKPTKGKKISKEDFTKLELKQLINFKRY